MDVFQRQVASAEGLCTFSPPLRAGKASPAIIVFWREHPIDRICQSPWWLEFGFPIGIFLLVGIVPVLRKGVEGQVRILEVIDTIKAFVGPNRVAVDYPVAAHTSTLAPLHSSVRMQDNC